MVPLAQGNTTCYEYSMVNMVRFIYGGILLNNVSQAIYLCGYVSEEICVFPVNWVIVYTSGRFAHLCCF